MNGNGHTEGSIVKIRRNPEPNDDAFKVKLSVKFLVTSLLACCLFAFSLGRAARLALLQRSIKHEVPRQREVSLPVFLTDGKVPQSSYYSQNLDTSKSSSSSSWLAINRHKPIPTNKSCDDDSESNFTEAVAEHVMVDIKHVDSSFLNSEHLLAHAMLEVVKESNLMLLSYHCHAMEPTGVSCVGVLRQNYISFHTWPQEGVITLDVCVGGSFASLSLLPAIPTIERVFGVQSRYSTEKPEMWWARKVRGFPQHSAPTDLYTYLINSLAAKVKDRVSNANDILKCA
jgi:S-adenosylmethionine/arginine decarboxylase-like enzyme